MRWMAIDDLTQPRPDLIPASVFSRLHAFYKTKGQYL